MPRIVRGIGDNIVYHVINRGNGRQAVFHKDKDYEAFMKLMKEAKEKYTVKVYGYCLMPNHFHMAVTPEKGEELSRWMQWLMTSHVRRYHRHYKSSGHVWQGRYKSFMIQQDSHLGMRKSSLSPFRFHSTVVAIPLTRVENFGGTPGDSLTH
jgi:putative transposase